MPSWSCSRQVILPGGHSQLVEGVERALVGQRLLDCRLLGCRHRPLHARLLPSCTAARAGAAAAGVGGGCSSRCDSFGGARGTSTGAPAPWLRLPTLQLLEHGVDPGDVSSASATLCLLLQLLRLLRDRSGARAAGAERVATACGHHATAAAAGARCRRWDSRNLAWSGRELLLCEGGLVGLRCRRFDALGRACGEVGGRGAPLPAQTLELLQVVCRASHLPLCCIQQLHLGGFAQHCLPVENLFEEPSEGDTCGEC